MTTTHRTVALSAGSLLLVAALAATLPQLSGHLGSAFDVLGGASRPWLASALLAFLAAFACTVGAWRAALTSAGGRICPRQAAARIGIGSLVNALAPAKLGDAVKIALCSRAIDAPERLWTAGGAYAALAATRSLTLAALVVVAAVTHALPLWPVFALLGGVAAVSVAAVASQRLRRHPRLQALLAGIRALATTPRALGTVIAWTVGMQLSRVAGAIAVALAFGLPHPVLAALVILPALDLAGTVPVTPGGLGVGSGAVAVALASRGIGTTQALAVGLAIQAAETVVSLACGSGGIAYLAQPSPRARRTAMRVAIVAASAAGAALVGAAVVALV